LFGSLVFFFLEPFSLFWINFFIILSSS
jgi:hypothetical protein